MFLRISLNLISSLPSSLFYWQLMLLKTPYSHHSFVLPYIKYRGEMIHVFILQKPLSKATERLVDLSVLLIVFQVTTEISVSFHRDTFSSNTAQWRLLGFYYRWNWKQSNLQETRLKGKNKEVLRIIQL